MSYKHLNLDLKSHKTQEDFITINTMFHDCYF